MRTDYPTTNAVEYGWFVALLSTPQYKQKMEYYHYTNYDNLPYILKDDCIDLRLTRADKFSDKQEMLYIVPILQDVCETLLQKGEINSDFYYLINECILKTKVSIEEFRHFYVFCMSANANSAYLKKNYACRGGKDGVIIGIQGLAFEDIQFGSCEDKDEHVYGINMLDVDYDRNKLESDFSKIIKNLFEWKETDCELIKAIELVVSALLMYSLVYKPTCYKYEEETRMIVDTSKLNLPKDKFYFDTDDYLHIIFPIDSLYEYVKVQKDEVI